MRDAPWCPEGWERREFSHGTHAHTYYVVGADGAPPVLLICELPGINDALVELAEDLAAEFRVFVPSILGRDGDPTFRHGLHQIFCVRREMHLLARHSVSRSVQWLRDFADHEVGSGEPYGVIGMCFTGGFALGMAVDPRVAAAVVAQPAVPRRADSLGLTEHDRDLLAEREGLCARGYRYRGDKASPPEKLEAAQDLLGDRMVTVQLDPPRRGAHTTLTGRTRSERAVREVKELLRSQLA